MTVYVVSDFIRLDHQRYTDLRTDGKVQYSLSLSTLTGVFQAATLRLGCYPFESVYRRKRGVKVAPAALKGIEFLAIGVDSKSKLSTRQLWI